MIRHKNKILLVGVLLIFIVMGMGLFKGEEVVEGSKDLEKEEIKKEDNSKEKIKEDKKEKTVKKDNKKEKVQKVVKKEKTVKKDDKKEKTKNKGNTVKKEKVLKTSKIEGEYMSTVSLNVRKTPSLTAKSDYALTPYKKVKAIEQTEKDGNDIVWYKVIEGDKTGWVSSNYLTEYKKQEERPKEVNKKEDLPKQVKKKQVKKESIKTKVQAVRGEYMSTKVIPVYDQAKGKVVGKLSPYQKITATHLSEVQGDNWYKVTFKGQVFWVNGTDIKTYKAPKTVENKTPKKAEKPSNQGTVKKHNYPPNSITYNGRTVYYKNTGQVGEQNGDGETSKAQKVIDTTNNASTYGGVATFSGVDGKNTHFIGHSNKQFIGMGNANKFVVTDSSGRAFEYVKTTRYLVEINGKNVSTGQDMIGRIIGEGGGERITLQYTEVHPRKWIIEAKFNREIK